MNAHSGLKFESSFMASYIYMVSVILLIVGYLCPGFVSSSPFFEELGQLSFVEVTTKSNSVSIYEVFKDNRAFNFVYFGIIFILLALFLTDISHRKISILPRFSSNVVCFYLLLFFSGLLAAAYERSIYEILQQTWIQLTPSVGVYMGGFGCVIALICAFVNLCRYYRWYPVQTLYWSLGIIVSVWLGVMVGGLTSIVSESLVCFLVILVAVILFSALLIIVKCRPWNESIRLRIATKRNDSVYLGYGETLYGENPENKSLYEEENNEKNGNKIWMICGGVAILALIVIGIFIINKPTPKETKSAEIMDESYLNSTENLEDNSVNKIYANESKRVSNEVTSESSPRESQYSSDNEVRADDVVEMRFKGYIDGKYEIEMHLNSPDEYGRVSGDYFYTKYKTPIKLSGSLDGDDVLTLEERVDGNLIGIFKGPYTSSHYSGVWEKADGTKSFTFDLHR